MTEAEVAVRQRFISIGCNRTPNAADCSKVSGRIAFGAHNTIALWDVTDSSCRGIHTTLKGHAGVVNAVRWVPGQQEGDEVIVSAGVDHTIRIWKESQNKFTMAQMLKDHTGSINCMSVLPQFIATGASDGSINIYSTINAPDYRLLQTIRIERFYPLTLAFHQTEDTILLAIGGSSSNIHLYVSTATSPSFQPAAILKGHEDWIRGLSFTSSPSEILLATASQDRYIRLWKIHPSIPQSQQPSTDTDALLTAALGGESYSFQVNEKTFVVTFSALLPGHDDWVFTVAFHPEKSDLLLSASADASLIIWRPDPGSGIWIPETRLGEVSSLKGATTAQGSSGGFWGGIWGVDGKEVASWGKTGGWRIWSEREQGLWMQRSAVGGAIRGVKGISWDPHGHFLQSVSLDQTTRMFGEWNRDGLTTWHEVARPQIHGYDLNTISCMKNWKFVSGADEKVLRVFQTSKATADLVARLANITFNTNDLPMTANLPVLGLSNKESTSTEDEIAPSAFLDNLTTPPLEDHLSRYTLSPELEKLYAHPSDIIAVSTSHSGQWIASSCKAATPANAVIRVFDTSTYAEIATLQSHGLTVTKLAWSPDDSLLVSVGRDRQWTLFDTKTWHVKKVMPKAHARIIWDVSFSPAELGYMFITASRDKSVKIWGGEKWDCLATVKFPESVTSCTFLYELVGVMTFVAVGLENGAIYILGCERDKGHWRVIHAFVERDTPSETVTAMEWRPCGGEGRYELAAAADDCSVRIYEVIIS